MRLFFRGGCFLPLLVIFNFFFGWIFFGFRAWVIMGILLIVVSLAYSYILSRKIVSESDRQARRKDAIDVEGKVLK